MKTVHNFGLQITILASRIAENHYNIGNARSIIINKAILFNIIRIIT